MSKIYEVLSTVVVHDLGWMTPKGRREVANWMRRQARLIEKNYQKVSKQYTARYYWPSKDMKGNRG